MAEYQARLLTRTGAAGPILAPGDLTYRRGLSNTGRCTFTVSLDYPGLTSTTIEPWRNELLLLRRKDADSAWQVAHDGPIIESECDDDAGTVTLTAGMVSSWLDRRNQRRSIGYARSGAYAADLDQIANDFIFLAQHPEPPFAYSSRADFKTVGSSHPTGTVRSYFIDATDRVNWLEKLNELAAGEPGFDWDIETAWDGTTRTRTFRTFSPARGSTVTTPLLRGRGLVGLRVLNSGDRAANYIEVFGSGGTALVSNAHENAGSQDTYGLLELLDTSSDINTKARLNDRAGLQRVLRKPPLRIVSAGYVVSNGLPWRFATLGDTVPVQATRGPMVVNGAFRIAEEEVTVSKGGTETVKLTFQDPLE